MECWFFTACILRIGGARKPANSSRFARLIDGSKAACETYDLEHAIPPSSPSTREQAMTGKLDAAFGFHEAALRLRSQRQQQLASNIANADTPNYKARDFDFAKALADASGTAGGTTVSAGAAPELARTAPAHLSSAGAGAAASEPPLLYRTGTQGGVDGNSVDMEVERNAFTDNALRYEASVTLINAQIKNMLAAIQG
jgi:flagellar basal-body rod protein FlgB